jgi:hypothetical protein
MLASGATTATTHGGRGESSAALLGLLGVGLLGQLENLGQRLALVRAHGLLDVRHPRTTLATRGRRALASSSCSSIGHFVFTREKI